MDMLVQSTDVPKQMTFRQAARKAVAMCVSDFAAKGVGPDSFMVSVGLARGVTKAQVRELSLGFSDASREWKLKLIGGDTSEAAELMISCVMLGFTRNYVKRAGARIGDAVVVTGAFGYPPAGLRILKGAKAASGFRRRAFASVLRPTPNLNLGLALGGYWTSSMDSSDGLARSLHILAKANAAGIELWKLPMDKGVAEFAASNGISAKKLVMEGGEEYLIVGTMRPGKVRAAAKVARRSGGELIEIGRVTEKRGVRLRTGGSVTQVPDAGWVHLR